MAIYLTTIAAASYLSQFPKALVFKTSDRFYENSGVATMIDSDDDKANEPQAPTVVGPYDFLNGLAELDASAGIKTQTELANDLGKVEGVVRGAVKAIARTVPIERLKEDGRGKLTELGIALVTACVNREDMTLEAWVHGLMEAMKSPEYKTVKGEKATAEDIDLSFMDEQIAATEAQSTALALASDNQFQALAQVNAQLDRQLAQLGDKELEASFQEGFQTEMDKLTKYFEGQMAAKKAFLEAKAKLGETPDF
jgi:hypothetical protein